MAIGPHPEFAWSVSRAGMFEFCPRKYYYRYYGMWGGWDERADEKIRLCYLLSKRTSLAGWVGQEVHRAAALYLRSGEPMERIVALTCERMRNQFRTSRARLFLRPGQAKEFGLTEHYYEPELADRLVRERWEQVQTCLEAFGRSPYRDDARAAKEAGRLVYVEDPDEADFDEMSFTGHGLGDFKIYAHPDFVIAYPDGTNCILDWKTGQPPAEGQDRVTDQLGLYALWAREKLELDPAGGRLEAYEVYWPGEQSRGDRIGPDLLRTALAFARASVEQMRALISDPEENAAEEADFEAHGTEARCATCEFRAVCTDRVQG